MGPRIDRTRTTAARLGSLAPRQSRQLQTHHDTRHAHSAPAGPRLTPQPPRAPLPGAWLCTTEPRSPANRPCEVQKTAGGAAAAAAALAPVSRLPVDEAPIESVILSCGPGVPVGGRGDTNTTSEAAAEQRATETGRHEHAGASERDDEEAAVRLRARAQLEADDWARLPSARGQR